MLKGIPKGTTFVLRVVEPLKAGFGRLSLKNSFSRFTLQVQLYNGQSKDT